MRSAAFFVPYRRDNRRKTSYGSGVNLTQVAIASFAPCANKCNSQPFYMIKPIRHGRAMMAPKMFLTTVLKRLGKGS